MGRRAREGRAQSARLAADVGGQLRSAGLLGEVRGGLAGEAWRTRALDARVSGSSHDQPGELVVATDDGQHERAEMELRRVTQVRSFGDQPLDSLTPAGVGGTHEGGQAVSVLGVDVMAVASHAAEDPNVPPGGSLFPIEAGRQRTESVRDIPVSCSFGHLERGLHVVNARDLVRVGSMPQQKIDHGEISLGSGEVQRREVVESSLFDVGAASE